MLYRAKVDVPVEDWVHGIASFDECHVLKSIPPEYIETVVVPTITPRELMDKHDIRHADLLQID